MTGSNISFHFQGYQYSAFKAILSNERKKNSSIEDFCFTVLPQLRNNPTHALDLSHSLIIAEMVSVYFASDLVQLKCFKDNVKDEDYDELKTKETFHWFFT